MMTSAGLPLAVVGCDFRVAPSSARSRLVLDEHQALALADELERGGWADGIVFLDTCNRNEWIVSSSQPAWAAQLLHSRMCQQLDQGLHQRVEPYLYVGDDAARHLFRVAIGQESLVVGERQISGQLFKALDGARGRGCSSRILNGMGSIAGRLVRIAMRRGCLEASAVGVHSLAIAWLRQELPPGPASVAVVGLGAIGRRVAGILDEDPRFHTVRCNRTVSEGSSVRPLDELTEILGSVDAAVFCTAAPEALVDPNALGLDRPLVLVDIGIPQQVEERPTERVVSRVGLDELVEWHQARGCEGAERACVATEALVERALAELVRFCSEPVFTPVLERVQRRHRALVGDELSGALRERLPSLSDAERSRLESELRVLLSGFTDDVLQAIRDGARHISEARKWHEE